MSVEMTERRTGKGENLRTQRLYQCSNGLALGAVRGGPLDAGDDYRPWEIFTIAPSGIPYGNSVGFVTDEQLSLAVSRLDDWLNHWPEPVSA